MTASQLDYYRQLHGQIDIITDRIMAAREMGDRRAEATEYLERANAQMCLRDYWGKDTQQGRAWQMWMWNDIRSAKKIMEKIA